MTAADDKRLQDQVNAANNPGAGASGGPCTKCPPGAHAAARHGQLVYQPCCSECNGCPKCDSGLAPLSRAEDTRSEVETLAEVLRGIGFWGTHADFGALSGNDDGKRLWTARAILTSDWLARHDAQVAAKALREAADEMGRAPKMQVLVERESCDWHVDIPVAKWLRDRADRIEGDR